MNETSTIGVPNAIITIVADARKNSMIKSRNDINRVISVVSTSFANLFNIRPENPKMNCNF